MGRVKHHLGQVLLWKYDRGSLAYDIIVVLILLFIFVTPRSCFERKIRFGSPKPAAAQPAPIPK
jgi:hypothetical protein